MTRALAITTALVACWPAARAMAAEPVVSIWYRGDASGAPVGSDLAVIRALGFNGVTWPRRSKDDARVGELRRMAAVAGLRVVLVDRPEPLSPSAALGPPDSVNIMVKGQAPGAITVLAWRAVAHGARTISFDAGETHGTGLENADGSLTAWAREAIALTRQLTTNARMVDAMRPGLGVIVSPDLSPALDVVLLDGGRSWVVIATNTSTEAVTASVRMPAGVPYALWLSWLDGTTLAMVGETAGPRWSLRISPHSARVYVIDKVVIDN